MATIGRKLPGDSIAFGKRLALLCATFGLCCLISMTAGAQGAPGTALHKEFANVWYRAGDKGFSLKAYSASGKLVITDMGLVFGEKNETLEIDAREIKSITWGKIPGDTYNEWAIVRYGEPEKVAGFKDGSRLGWGTDTKLIYSTLKTAFETSVPPGGAQSGNPPLNLIPMYGYPEIEKPEALKKSDEDFIRSVVGTEESREEVSKRFAGEGWRLLSNGDAANAMRRFNQSWLLNPNYYQPYWGFGALLLAQRKPSEAATHFEKALSLINEESEKPRLLSDTSRAYTVQGALATDKMKAEEYFGKANLLLDEAVTLNPKYGNAYRNWAMSLYYQGNYEKAWTMVRNSRGLAGQELSSDFINMLSKQMPEPK